MIPKKIHYCWFGGNPLPDKAKKCIASWKNFCPDYEITEWNEENFNVCQNAYLKWCYDHKKWAFLSDYARLLIISEYGGIYFDTDVELIRNPEHLFQFDAFYGFEDQSHINTGLGFGAVPHHQTVEAMKKMYSQILPDAQGNFDLIGCPQLNTDALLPLGLCLDGSLQNICGAKILPVEYLNPYDDPTGRLNKTDHTISIHWFSKSWMNKKEVTRSVLMKPLHRIFGVDAFARFRK